jgi:two-component system chemotaxis response regulator CheY
MNTVLLVDDSKTILMSLTAIVEKHGYKAVTAVDGALALGLITSGLRPNVVVTDLNMPNMDGITFIREARKTPGMKFVPILMLTTESQQAKRLEAKTAGATGWLVKPVGAESLIDVLKQVLPRS